MARLAAIKQGYDPGNMFRTRHGLAADAHCAPERAAFSNASASS
ncbi:BBE domain-containing protein [Rhodococcus gannanensis]|uniref:BBE domain-containing protein n=1 Tax=Rhodococcus gannanensis TaxID=1960308 RepID=A0ABW4P5C4_9NOCA